MPSSRLLAPGPSFGPLLGGDPGVFGGGFLARTGPAVRSLSKRPTSRSRPALFRRQTGVPGLMTRPTRPPSLP
eukprot:8633815-Pyramimonas_sp.AAC.1